MSTKPPFRTADSVDRALVGDKLPQVDSYYDKVHQATWIGRTAGLWAGVGFGAGFGGLIGAAASFLPMLVNGAPLPDLTVIGQTAAIFGGVGTMLGITICADVGVTASAVAAGFEEKERRDKLEKLREKNPELAAKLEKENTTAFAEHQAEPETLGGKAWKLFNKFVNLKVMLTGMVLGATVGAMFGFGDFKLIGDLLGKSVERGTPAFIAASTGSIAMLGAVFGVKMSYLSNLVTNFTYRILSGKIFQGDTPTPEQAKNTELAKQTEKLLNNNLLENESPKTEHSFISYRALINEQRVTNLANHSLLIP